MGAIAKIAEGTSWVSPPKRPGTLDRIQMITSALSLGCGDAWTVYVETLKKPTALALLAYFDFGVMDVWRGFYKPRDASRGVRRSPLSRARRRRGFDVDLGDWLGKRLRPSDFANRTITDGQRTLWRFSFAIERLLWWWMVIDIAWDFAYDWASEIHRAAADTGCTPFRCTWTTDTTFILLSGRWEAVECTTPIYAVPDHWGWASTIDIPAGYRGGAICACVAEPADPFDPPINPVLAVARIGGDGTFHIGQSSTGTQRADGRHYVLHAQASAGENLAWVGRKDGGGHIKITQATFTGYAVPA